MKRFLGIFLICLIAAASMMTAVPEHVHAADRICPDCGAVLALTSLDVQACNYGPSIYIYRCLSCGYEDWDSLVSRYDHKYAEAGRTAATCTSKGSITYTCTVCGDTYTSSLAALGHSYKTDHKDATCTEEGYDNKVCSRCGDTQKNVIAALGHDYETVTTEATCTEAGSIVQTCKRCGDVQEEIIPALGHDYDEVRTEPTCTGEGASVKTCRTCGEVTTEILAAKGHTFGEWVTDVEPALYKKGHEHRECTVCSYREDRDIPAKTIPVPAIVVGAAAVIAAAAGLVMKNIKKIKKFGKPELSEKKIFMLLGKGNWQEEMTKFLKARRYLDLDYTEETEAEAIGAAVSDSEPDLVLLEVGENSSLEQTKQLMEAVKTAYEDATFGIATDDGLPEETVAQLEQMLKDEEIVGYASPAKDFDGALAKIFLPIYKTEITLDGTVESVGTVADMLGIPYVSTITNAFLEGKSIKETVEEGELSVSSAASVIGSIASIFGWDTVGSVAGLVDNVDTIKEAIDKDAGVNEGADAVEAGADIVDVVTDILS